MKKHKPIPNMMLGLHRKINPAYSYSYNYPNGFSHVTAYAFAYVRVFASSLNYTEAYKYALKDKLIKIIDCLSS